MFDVEIQLRTLPRDAGWLVDLRSVEPPAFVAVPPLRDSDLADLDLPPSAKTWKGFLTALSPGGGFVPGSAVLRTVGSLIMERLLGSREVAQHLAGVEQRAERENRAVRLLIEVDEGDPVLACLPIELAFDGNRFYFKRSGRPSFRVAPYSEARNIHLGPGSRVLIVTAHSDLNPQPDEVSLKVHAAAVMKAVQKAGFEAAHLPDATREGLRSALHSGPVVDLLYIVCHGIEDPDRAGQLILRDGSLFGEDLARWLEVAVEKKRAVQAVILCACSSALPQAEEGTLGMAQWLVRPGRALAALGFRGPVLVSWALRWSERLFDQLAQGDSLEDAFAEARCDEPDGEPQWVLPVLYARRRDPDAKQIEAPAEPTKKKRGRGMPPRPVSPPLPRRPRPYFTGRTKDLQVLRDWVRTPGAAQITAVQGWGGIGKSELATVLAHEERAAGRFVIWLDRPDRDVQGAQAALVGVCEPGFRPAPGMTKEDLAGKAHQLLRPHDGLLVLDDITDRSVVEQLLPGGGWNVLVTTRVRGLLPGAFEVDLQPLETGDALRLLSRVAWSAEAPPETERSAAERLVDRLGRLPLAIELAGATLRDLVSAEEYLKSLDLNEGAAASDQAKVEATLLRTLADLEEADERAFLALGILPGVGASVEVVADTLGETKPRVTRRLDRLVRYSLAMWSPETQRYGLHPFLRRAAKARARSRPKIWNDLHAGAAHAIEELAQWVREPEKAELVQDRWSRYRDFFESLNPSPWRAGAPGRDRIESALHLLADLLPGGKSLRPKQRLPDRSKDPIESPNNEPGANDPGGKAGYDGYTVPEPDLPRLPLPPPPQKQAARLKEEGDSLLREGNLSQAALQYDGALALYQTVGDLAGQASVLGARGELQRHRSDLDGASQDYDQALAIFQTLGDTWGQAAVLLARGDLNRLRTSVDRASQDYDQAFALYEAVGSPLGKANVLKARGDLRQAHADFLGARRDYEEALALYKTIGDSLGLGNVLKALGDLSRLSGDFQRAAGAYQEALNLFEKTGNRLGLANTFQAFGDLGREGSKLREARQWYQKALDIYQQLQDPTNIGNVLAELARISALEGDKRAALALAAEAIRISIPSENAYATGLAEDVQKAVGGEPQGRLSEE